MRKITFDAFDDAIGAVGDFSDGLGSNVTITSDADGTFMFFDHGEKVAPWSVGSGPWTGLGSNIEQSRSK